MIEPHYTYEQIQEAANFIRTATNTTAKVGVIAHAELGVFPKSCANGTTVWCSAIPGLGDCTDDDCASCPNSLHAGHVDGTPVIAVSGRIPSMHTGSIKKIALVVRALKLLGIETLILIATACGLNPDYKVGDLMLVKDHINFPGMTGHSPLAGHKDDQFGPRLFSVNAAYDDALRGDLGRILTEVGYSGNVHEGVYFAVAGPAYPTPAEKRCMKKYDADAVGMYIVQEVMCAAHCGLKVGAICVITEDDAKTGEANYDYVGGVSDDKLQAIDAMVTRLVKLVGGDTSATTNAEAGVQARSATATCCKCNKKKKQPRVSQQQQEARQPTSNE